MIESELGLALMTNIKYVLSENHEARIVVQRILTGSLSVLESWSISSSEVLNEKLVLLYNCPSGIASNQYNVG